MNEKKDIYVLGIHDGHCAGAVILKNGRIVAAINEERITMVKNQAGVPALSIAKVIDIAGIQPSDITLVAIASRIRIVDNPEIGNTQELFRLHSTIAPLLHGKTYIALAVELLRHLKPRTDVLQALHIIGIDRAPVVYIDHHTAHATSAYFRKPWKGKTLVFTLDGMGDGVSATVSIGEGTTMRRIAQSSFYDSPSDILYSEITEYLGLKRCEHEYKVMGLAPYGDYKKTIETFRSVMRLNPANPLEFENTTRFYVGKLQLLYQKYLHKKRFDDIAAGVQKHFEDLVTAWVREGIRLTHIHAVAAGGGSFLNVKTNMLIRSMPEVSELFVYPACDDSGIAEGAAIAAYTQYCADRHRRITVEALGPLYLGQAFPLDRIEAFLKEKKLLRRAQKADPERVARMMGEGSIIARFAGRDEWGPRALGNRSILADPRNLATVQRLNSAIKHRDFWMPFAPAILAEDQPRYILHGHFSPYMVETFETNRKTTSDIIATVHPADHTTRPMTVNGWNPAWRHIIMEFKKITGVGALLNTSCNLHGYPLVGTPEHALWTFENSGLDGLILEDYLITK